MVDVAVAIKDDTAWYVAKKGSITFTSTNITIDEVADRCP